MQYPRPRKRGELRRRIRASFDTQADFAYAVGTHEAIVSRVVNGRQDLPTHVREQWAKVLDREVAELFPNEAR